MIHLPFQNMREFLQVELAPSPDRWGFTWRLVLTGVLAVIISSGCQIPYMDLSIIVVFYTVQSNSLYTRVAAILILASLPIAVASGILMLRYTYDYPLLRILCGSAIFLVSMYFIRVLKIGIAFLGVALVGIYVQTYADLTDQAEYIVHQIAWAFVAMLYPAILSLVVCGLLFPSEPGRQLRDAVRRQLGRVADRLAELTAGPQAVAVPLAGVVRREIGGMGKLQLFADVDDKDGFAAKAYRRTAVAAASELLYAAAALPENALPLSVSGRLRSEVLALSEAVGAGRVYHKNWTPDPGEAALLQSQPELEDMYRTLAALDRFVPPTDEPKKPKMDLLASDALTNPVYFRFALKALLASLIAYTFYNAVRWEGIHTAMLTCCIVAYPTLGSSMRKTILRVLGGVFGSLSALLLFIFVMPYIDSVVGLLLAVTPFLAVGAWVAGGSERIAYVGVQMVVTLSLALLSHSGPTSDLTEIRDRIFGILIGITISMFLYANIWPESEAAAVRGKIVEMLRALSAFVRPEAVTVAGDAEEERAVADQMAYVGRRIRCVSLFNECEETLERVALEPEYRSGRPALLLRLGGEVLELSQKIMYARDRLHRKRRAAEAVSPAVAAGIQTLIERSSALLDAYATAVERQADAAPREERRLLSEAESGLAALWTERAADLIDDARHLARRVSELPDWSAGGAPDFVATQEVSQP